MSVIKGGYRVKTCIYEQRSSNSIGYGVEMIHKSLTVLHLLNSPANTLRASITIIPDITALVVAMAGIILPAIAIYMGEEIIHISSKPA